MSTDTQPSWLNRQIPQELLDLIVEHTLHPWPASHGSSYDAALNSRLKNPFLFVNKRSHDIIHNDLAQALWFDVQFTGRIDAPATFNENNLTKAYIPHTVPISLQRILPLERPTITLVFERPVRWHENEVIQRSAPFNFDSFIATISMAVTDVGFAKLECSNLTDRQKQFITQQIVPVLKMFLISYNAKLKFCNGMPSFQLAEPELDTEAELGDYIEISLVAFRHYHYLRSLKLHAEADVFMLHVGVYLRCIECWDDSVHPFSQRWEAQAFREPARVREYVQNPDIHWIKLQKDIEMIGAQALIRAIRTHETLDEKYFTNVTERRSRWSYISVHFGFSDREMARIYHTCGFMSVFYEGLRDDENNRSWIQKGVNMLAIASAMSPENEEWKRDLEASKVEFVRSQEKRRATLRRVGLLQRGDEELQMDWEEEWRKQCTVFRHKYVDTEGVEREWIGDKCRAHIWDGHFEYLPRTQKYIREVVDQLREEVELADHLY